MNDLVAEFDLRRLEPEDVDAVYGILAGWMTDVFGEVEFSRGMFANIVAIADHAFVAEACGKVVGHADMRRADINVLVRRDARRRGIGTALLRACEEQVVDASARLHAVDAESAAAPFARANRYERAWEYWFMGLDLPAEPEPPAWPEGVRVRSFRPEDAVAVKELLDLAYAGEPDHVPLPFDDWKLFMLTDPSFDPTAWFLAEEPGGRLVGACLNWKDGYVKDLVVHPDWRRRGLGKALMLRTFGEFAARGIPRVTLKTDSLNPTHAWRLYERLGMRRERTYEVFEKRL